MIENNEELYFDSEEYVDIIIYYLELGDISFAETASTFGLKLHPNSLEIKIKHFEVLLELENYLEAKNLMRELASEARESTDYLVCCAKYYSNLGNPKKAIVFCKEALDLGEEENFLHNFIADEYDNLNLPDKALMHYRIALNYDSMDDYSLENVMRLYKELGCYEDAVNFLKDFLDLFPFSDSAWIEYGNFYRFYKNYTEALVGYDYALAIVSDSVNVLASKALCFEEMGNWAQAIEVYNDMLPLEYTKAFTLYKIGLCYKNLNLSEKALTFFQESLKEDPQFYLSMNEQSLIYENRGQITEALYFAEMSSAHNVFNLDQQRRLAFLNLRAGNILESSECIKTLLDEEPSVFYTWYAYAEVLMILGSYPEALETLEKAIKLHPRAELYYQQSNCFFHLKDEKKGQESLKIALSLNEEIAEDMQLKYPHIKKNIQKFRKK